MTFANPILVFIQSLALLLIGCAIGIHWRTSAVVWIAACGALLTVIHDLLEGLVWFGVTVVLCFVSNYFVLCFVFNYFVLCPSILSNTNA